MKRKNKTKPQGAPGAKPRAAWLNAMIKGVLAGLIGTALCIMAFAFIIKAMNLSDGAIGPINVGIKMAMSLLTAFVCLRRYEGKLKWLLGAGSSMLMIVFGFLLLSLLDGGMGHLSVLMGDMVMGGIVGFATAMLMRLMPSKKKRKR